MVEIEEKKLLMIAKIDPEYMYTVKEVSILLNINYNTIYSATRNDSTVKRYQPRLHFTEVNGIIKILGEHLIKYIQEKKFGKKSGFIGKN